MAAAGAAVRAAEFDRLGSTVYLNAAAYAPLPERSLRVARHLDERRAAAALELDQLVAGLARARQACATLIGADAAEIALTPSTSAGLNVGADIVRQHASDGRRTVILPDREFPANVYGWLGLQREGFTAELVAVDERGCPREDVLYERLQRGDVVALAISAVQFATGYRVDLQKLGEACVRNRTLFIVDAMQAAGVVPIDVRAAHVDVLACGGQKWLCSPFGTGFVYVRHALALQSEPRRPGWLAFESSADFARLLDYRWDLWDDARRFEVGSPAFHDFAALAHSVELILEVGPTAILEHVRALHQPLLEWAAAGRAEVVVADAAHGSAILAVNVPDAYAIHDALARADIICAPREGALRFAPHLYNTAEDMERVVEVLLATVH